jgi:hypothetical protein
LSAHLRLNWWFRGTGPENCDRRDIDLVIYVELGVSSGDSGDKINLLPSTRFEFRRADDIILLTPDVCGMPLADLKPESLGGRCPHVGKDGSLTVTYLITVVG